MYCIFWRNLNSYAIAAGRLIPEASERQVFIIVWNIVERRSRSGLRRSLPVLLLVLSLRIAGTLLIASLMRGRVVLTRLRGL